MFVSRELPFQICKSWVALLQFYFLMHFIISDWEDFSLLFSYTSPLLSIEVLFQLKNDTNCFNL